MRGKFIVQPKQLKIDILTLLLFHLTRLLTKLKYKFGLWDLWSYLIKRGAFLMKHKKLFFTVTILAFIGFGCKISAREKGFVWTKEGVKKKISEFMQRKLTIPRYWWNEYANTQSGKDAKQLYKIVKNEILKDPKNFKKITIKKYSMQNVFRGLKNKIKIGLEILIFKRIKEINPNFLCKKHIIAKNIVQKFRCGDEKSFIGDSLTKKIKYEMRKISKKACMKKPGKVTVNLTV